MSRGPGRRLTDAEIEVWLAVASTVTPRRGARRPSLLPQQTPAPPPLPAPAPAPSKDLSAPFLPPYVPPGPRPKGLTPLAPLEKRYRQKVTRGHVAIDRAIDLHGMTQAQAHGALRGFLRGAAADGARLVLVVTGKGRARMTSAGEPGVLRQAVPHWLRAEDLRPVVMGFEEAGLPHGGFGALYVRLRRREG